MEKEKELSTLEKVIKRDEYKRLSENLKERVEELAVIVRKKARELDIDEVMGYEVREYKSNISVEDKLSIYVDGEGYHSLEDINSTYWLHNDFSCRVIGANVSEGLEFLNSVKGILAELDKIETKKVDEIQNALNDTMDVR